MKRPKHLVLKAILPVVTGLTVALPALSYENWEDYHQFIQIGTVEEHKGKWKEINWINDPEKAKLRAIKENKPILVFMLIGYLDQRGANDG